MNTNWEAPDVEALIALGKTSYRSEYHIGDGMWEREWVITKDTPMESHVHNFGHRTSIGYGSVRVFCWREALNMDGSKAVGPDGKQLWVSVPLAYPIMCSWQPRLWSRWIPADCRHRFEAITPVVFGTCTFLSRDPLTGAPVDYKNGNEAAYE